MLCVTRFDIRCQLVCLQSGRLVHRRQSWGWGPKSWRSWGSRMGSQGFRNNIIAILHRKYVEEWSFCLFQERAKFALNVAVKCKRKFSQLTTNTKVVRIVCLEIEFFG